MEIALSIRTMHVKQRSSGTLKKEIFKRKAVIEKRIQKRRQKKGSHILFLQAETLHFRKRVKRASKVTRNSQARAK